MPATFAIGERLERDDCTCTLCASRSVEVVFNRGRDGVTLHTGVCLHCGNIFSVPRPTDEEVAKLYESGDFSVQGRGATGFNRKHLLRTYGHALKRWNSLRELPGFSEKARILDVGSGMGAFLRIARLAGHPVEGIEPDTQMAAQTAELFQVPVHGIPMENVGLPAGSFDLVVSFHTIEHVLDPLAFLGELKRLGKPGGLVVIECPALDHGHTRTVEDFFWPPHINVFTEKTLRAFLESAGLVVEHSGSGALGVVAIGRIPEVAPPAAPAFPTQSVAEVLELIKQFGVKEGDLPRILPPALRQMVPHAARVWLGKLRRALGNPRALATLFDPPKPPPSVFKEPASEGERRTFLHVGLHRPGNAGDTVLFETVRALLDQRQGRQDYRLVELQRPFTRADVKQGNDACDAFLVGGGGLIIPDSNPNERSGWQWDISLDDLKALEKPLIVFAIGFNLFRGQDQPEQPFTEHITETVRRAAFFGMRNHGSIRRLRGYLPEELHSKVVFQPCMTTALHRLVKPELLARSDDGARRIGINLAFDREDLRFPSDLYTPLERVASFAKQAVAMGWKVDYVAHTKEDRIGEIAFQKLGVDYRFVNLQQVPTEKVLRYYAGINLAMGMRGHSQMIPFGLGTPIFSLISHDKMAYFLEDIGETAWGAEVMAEDLEARLANWLEAFTPEAEAACRETIARHQERLWQITVENVETVFEALKAGP